MSSGTNILAHDDHLCRGTQQTNSRYWETKTCLASDSTSPLVFQDSYPLQHILATDFTRGGERARDLRITHPKPSAPASRHRPRHPITLHKQHAATCNKVALPGAMISRSATRAAQLAMNGTPCPPTAASFFIASPWSQVPRKIRWLPSDLRRRGESPLRCLRLMTLPGRLLLPPALI